MAEKAYSLTEAEQAKLRDGLLAAYLVPLIDDVEDYVWEAIFHHVKGIKLADPITEGRNKQLFDAVAPDGRGWSLKTLVWANQTVGSNFEFVIQRADVFKKAVELGFKKGLTAKSFPNNLGKALCEALERKISERLQGAESDRPEGLHCPERFGEEEFYVRRVQLSLTGRKRLYVGVVQARRSWFERL